MGILSKLFGGGGAEKGQGPAAQLLSQLTSDLNLNADQLTKMKAAFQSFREARKQLKEQGGDIKDQMRARRQELKAGIISILTPEQQQKFQANLEKYKDFFQH
jgi:Spy/CpxP family protein refolding chaperone